MKALMNKARRFVRVEDGLVTVEWVALTAGMVVAAVAIAFVVMDNTADEAASIGSGIDTAVDAAFGTTPSIFLSK